MDNTLIRAIQLIGEKAHSGSNRATQWPEYIPEYSETQRNAAECSEIMGNAPPSPIPIPSPIPSPIPIPSCSGTDKPPSRHKYGSYKNALFTDEEQDWTRSPCEDCRSKNNHCACEKFKKWFPGSWNKTVSILRKKWGAET